MSQSPGKVRDSIVRFLSTQPRSVSVAEIVAAVSMEIGEVSPSSVRSYLTNNVPDMFERPYRGSYKLAAESQSSEPEVRESLFQSAPVSIGRGQIWKDDSLNWMANAEPCSIEAIVTDPPYGLLEYTSNQKRKLRNGKGGVWRVPPSFDGSARSPLPRFTILNQQQQLQIYDFFHRFGMLAHRILVPGANLIVASNPLFSHIVASALSSSGFELRGYIVRQVMTMRGGDRPKNAHHDFSDVSVLPRSQWEPWVNLRKPPEGRIQDNLRKYGTGGFRRISDEQPFGDLIKSSPTPKRERQIAPHPSLKPQKLMRELVRGSLPLGKGVVLDPFMGGGATIAAANRIGYESIGIEIDEEYFNLAKKSIEELEKI